jgi:hypothetical protein
MKKFMMVAITLIATTVINSQLFAQKKRESIISEQIADLSVNYTRSVDLDKGDTLLYFYLGFQNAKYTSITDIKSVFITNKTNFQLFMKDLVSAYKFLLTNEKTSIDWDRSPLYKISIYDFNNSSLYLTEGKGTGGYTTLNKSVLMNLLRTMSQIDFGNVVLQEKKDISELK